MIVSHLVKVNVCFRVQANHQAGSVSLRAVELQTAPESITAVPNRYDHYSAEQHSQTIEAGPHHNRCHHPPCPLDIFIAALSALSEQIQSLVVPDSDRWKRYGPPSPGFPLHLDTLKVHRRAKQQHLRQY